MFRLEAEEVQNFLSEGRALDVDVDLHLRYLLACFEVLELRLLDVDIIGTLIHKLLQKLYTLLSYI